MLTLIALAAAVSPIIERNRFVVGRSYPAESAQRGEEGDVTFRIRTNRRGQVDGCQVIRSSGFRRLDEATCDMILRGATATPLRNADGQAVAGNRDALVEWRLPERYALAHNPVFDTRRGAPGSAYNCHRQMRKNSLMIEQKICVSDDNWARQVAYAQAEAHSMQMPAGSPGGLGF